MQPDPAESPDITESPDTTGTLDTTGAVHAGGEATPTIDADLSELDAVPLHEHAARYEQVHAQLQAALREIDGG